MLCEFAVLTAAFPVPSEFQPGFAIYCGVAVFLSGLCFVALNLLWYVEQRRRAQISLSPKVWFFEIWRKFLAKIDEFEARSIAYTEAHRGKIDFRLIGLIVVACFSVATIEYYGSSGNYSWFAKGISHLTSQRPEDVLELFEQGPRARLLRLAYWALSIFALYFLIPAAFAKLVLKLKLRDLGLQFKGLGHHAWIYVGLFLIVFPFVVAVSTTASFQASYPFYDQANRSLFDFFAWEMVYLLQFFALEFFYRGVLIHGLKGRFGFYSILVSVIPYCMIHFGKPYPETLGAVIAGLALGILSLFSESIWLGVLIHISIALSMDFLSLAGQGLF